MEAMYQYAWRYRLYGGTRHTLCDGRSLRIVSPGVLNTDAGPDFSHARLTIDGTVWCGNVELHVRASDWYRHGHHLDMVYDSVVLHVVAVDDARIQRADGSEIPQVVIKLPEAFERVYNEVSAGLHRPACHDFIATLPPLEVVAWRERMGMERLQSKSAHAASLLAASGGDWQYTLFVIMARALGFGLNADPMEMLARSIPINYLGRHSDNLLQIEALLFGQAGMLNPDLHLQDAYYQALCREYRFLNIKYSLRPISSSVWKFARTRPQNFPYRRISILAHLLFGGFTLKNDILSAMHSTEELRKLFMFPLTGYWARRYSFGVTEMSRVITLSEAAADLLLLNAVVPFLYTYGCKHRERACEELAQELIHSLRPENNSLVRSWASAGLFAENAFESQALLYLKREYCDRERCRECRFAHLYISQTE